MTHAPAVAAVQEGYFDTALDGTATIAYSTFDSGTEAGEALLAEGLDATFIGPNPAINAFAQTDGEAVRIVAGTTSGGAALVVNHDIQSAEDLEGHTIATPSLGNTQDVAARACLTEEGFEIRRRRWRRRPHRQPRQLRHPRRLPGRHGGRRLGPRALGHPPGAGGRR